MFDVVRKTVSAGDTNRLRRRLAETGFGKTDAFLITVAVALTRNLGFPDADVSVHRRSDSTFAVKLIDALAVAFLFNTVNRVANYYDLQPEWAAYRRTESLRRITRSLMARGLPYMMPIDDDGECTQNICIDFGPLLRQFGVDSVSPVWKRLSVLPTVELAIGRLLRFALDHAATETGVLEGITRTCLDSRQPDARGDSSPIWRQLFHAPHRPLPFPESGDRRDDPDTIDIVLRVALLAAVHKLNDGQVHDLVLQAFDD